MVAGKQAKKTKIFQHKVLITINLQIGELEATHTLNIDVYRTMNRIQAGT